LLSLLFTFSFVTAQEKLEIDGSIIIKDSEDPDPVPGTIRFNPITNDFEGWNGIYWASLTGNQHEIGEMMDQEGNVYPTIIIGEREWMAKKLRTSTYRNGNEISLIGNDAAGDAAWSAANYGAYCIYDTSGTGYQAFAVSQFGYLYNWYAVNDGRGLCPTGWHVPTDEEWSSLTTPLGGSSAAGGSMKQAGTIYWESPNVGATNESGFSGLPAGIRNHPTTQFIGIGSNTSWWSSDESTDDFAVQRTLGSTTIAVGGGSLNKEIGMSIRCIKD
jgi:uncharacterized protein (TIGR02145 family)